MNTLRDKPKSTHLIRISEAARLAGVSTQTVEYYILLGLVKPRRKPGRRGRYFDRALIRRIHLIHSLNQSGYTLRDIRETFLSR
jgi:DNA-binding transcriptional MerR regulator